MKQEPELPPLLEEKPMPMLQEDPQTIVLPELTFDEYNQCLMMEEYTNEVDYNMEEEKGNEFAVFNLIGKTIKDYFFLMEYFCSFSEMTELDIMTQHKKEYRYFCYRYLNYIRNIALPAIKKNEIWEAVLIEYRKFPHLEFIIRNMIYRLGKRWSHTVVCGSYNYFFMKKMCGRIDKNIKVIKTNIADLKTTSEYSSFLSGLYFWNLLNGKKILIYIANLG
jgi:hypothetical protein